MSFVDKFKDGKKAQVGARERKRAQAKTKSTETKPLVPIKKAKFVGVKEAVRDYGYSIGGLYNLACNGLVATIKTKGKLFFLVVELEKRASKNNIKKLTVKLNEMIGALADYAEVEPTKWSKCLLCKEALKVKAELDKAKSLR